MASLTFPLSIGTFWNQLNIAEIEWSLSEAREINITGGGNVIDANLGSAHRVLRAVYPHLQTSRGAVVLFSSTSTARSPSALITVLRWVRRLAQR